MTEPGHDPALPPRALVTGAGKRLGRRMAVALAEDGFDVALHARTGDAETRQLATEIERMGRRTCLVTGDLADAGARAALVASAGEALGPLGLLVNNAASFPDDQFADFDAERLASALQVDLVAPLVMAQAFARQLPENAHGLIVNMLDQRVLKPTLRRFSYTLAKSALWTATRMMARELGPRIRVAGIGPGIAIRDLDMDQASFERLSARAPLGWAGDADEVVAALRYLLAARSVTGQMILVDGGMHLG